MAIVLRGMSEQETAWLTDAMLRSGERVDLSDVPGVKIGKHSTGGVGDKVSIVLVPLAAACGVIVPKMSGRGLGHTGGTLDKLESIPGYRTDLVIDEFKRVLRTVGGSIIGQSASLVPADKRMYALRDVTATVSSIPLIAASVMSKKLAEGSNALILDVKCGDGAFMKNVADARALATSMVALGAHAGVPTEAFITDMDAPLGRAIGNSLEIVECVETLKGRGPADLVDVVMRIATRMVLLAGIERGLSSAAQLVENALVSGRGLETLVRMIRAHGGDPRIVEDNALLPQAPDRHLVQARSNGFVTALRAEALGRASNALGAGRLKMGDPVDHAVGVVLLAARGAPVVEGQPLIELHHRGGRGLQQAVELCGGAIAISEEPPPHRDEVLGEVR
jgi:pyrimidine-nucleoside phosphorylase